MTTNDEPGEVEEPGETAADEAAEEAGESSGGYVFQPRPLYSVSEHSHKLQPPAGTHPHTSGMQASKHHQDAPPDIGKKGGKPTSRRKRS